MDKELELAAINPEEFLATPQNKRTWDMSIDDVARAISYNPREVLLTKAEQNPQSYGWVKTAIANIGRGAEKFFSPETGAQALVEIYSSPNMPKEKADRLIEDIAYSRYAGRMAEELTKPVGEQLGSEKYPVTAEFSQGIGQFIAQTVTGMANPTAAWVALYGTSQGQMEEGLVDKYIEQTGGIKGYADRKRLDDTLIGGFAAFNTLIERGIGAERIIERAFRNPSRAGLKTAMEQILNPNRLASKQILKQTLKQGAKQAMKAGTGELGEEFFQEYLGAATEVAAGYGAIEDLLSDEQLQKALIAGAYGGAIGATAGFGMHSANRVVVKKRVNEWAKNHGLTLTNNQLNQIANELIDETQDQAMGEVMAMAEIQNKYGEAFNTVKKRLMDQINATETVPWQDKAKTKEEYVETLANSITYPAINVANQLGIPLKDFLEIADVESWVIGNIAGFKPITSVADIDQIIANQDAIIKDQREKKKLGIDNPDVLNNAKQRKAIAERVRREITTDQEIAKRRSNSRKATADYITAKELQPASVASLENATTAQEGEDYTLFAGKKIPVEYQVVELSSIQPSHINGTKNPNYTNEQLQNRASRGTTQDVADLREKASVESFTPERLMKSATSAEGAPVVNAQGEVIAGNGRAEIVRYAYENPETAEKYKQAIANAGFNIEGMAQPILIRRNTTMTADEQIAAADLSNISETSAFDEASQARMDSKYLEGSKTPMEFATKLPMSERRGLMQNNGRWNQRRVQQRYESALLSWLCGNDTQLFERLVLDRGISQKVLDVLTSNGNLIYETATKYPDMQIREDIYHALVKMQNTTRDNFLEMTQQLSLDGHDVMPENVFVWNWLFTDSTTNRQFLDFYLTTLAKNQEEVNAGADMFGDIQSPLSKKDALIQALKKADQAKAEMAASRGREYEPLFNENGVTNDPVLLSAIASYKNQFASASQLNQGRKAQPRGSYDPELQTIILNKNWNELTLVHEFHHRYLELMWGYFKQAQSGARQVSQAWLEDVEKLFGMLEIDPNQDQLTTVQQEKFTYMVEAYLTGLGVDNTDNLAFQGFLHWIPEQYRSIMDLGYLDENNIIQNPMLDEEAIAWFNKWFASPFAPSLPSAPDAQRMVNPTDENGELVPANQKTMNNREKEWGQDSEEQLKADAQLYRAIGENNPSDMRAALDGEKELMKAEAKNLPDDTKLPETPKQTFRERWFKARETNARERAAEMARKYLAENPEHARELAFADPETTTEYDAPVDQGMLIRAVMETVQKGSDEWYILNDNLAMVKSMSGSTLALSGDMSHQAYLDAKREIEAARELKAATNYAGTSKGAIEKWDSDIKAFIAKRAESILALEANSEERKVAIKAMLEEAKTKFSGNTTNAILNQLDLTGMRTKSTDVFIKWAEKQIKQAAHAKIDATEQKELMKASIAAQLALRDIDSQELKDGKYTRAVQSGKDIRHWQYVKDKMKKAYIGRWGKFGIFVDNLFGSYAPSAMLMSVNTLFFANVPSTAINTGTIRIAASFIGKNKVDKNVLKGEIKRIKQVFNASGMNLAQMDKPTSPSTLHGEKYMNTEQKHWYNFTFEVLGRTDNEFRVPTFVDTLARIATKNANGDATRATALFKEYCRLNTTSEEAQLARKQALAVANMAVFTQDGIMASALNHIRSSLNTMSRGLLGLQPNGFGLGNILAPFLKTGVNITQMGLSSTLALPRSIIMAMKKLQGKQIPEIDKIALRSDWINLAWMSVVMAVLAMINSDDDKWYEEPYQPGRGYDPNKPYDSVNFGGVWIKLDIFGPMAIPMRAALKMVQDWEKKKMDAIADGLFFGGMEALSDTPLIQQFTDSSLDYMTKQPGAYWSGFGYNQAMKLVPAQLKTLTKAGSRAADVKWETDWMGKTLSKKFHRNYGLDGERLTTNDLINILTNRAKIKVEK